jgi:Protein of unknown function (DUF2510)
MTEARSWENSAHNPQAAPGWYPDPSDAMGKRYFDGKDWTEHHIPDDGRRQIVGSILSLTGVSGIATGQCAVSFERESVIVTFGYNQLRLDYSDVTSLQLAGRGAFVTKSGGGWMGGGFGAQGMIEGFALATVLNALTTTTKYHIETIVHLNWHSGSLTLLNTQLLPGQWEFHLTPVFQRIQAAQPKPALSNGAQHQPGIDETVCPYCAETIKAAAIKCPHCRSDLQAKH